MANEIVSFWIDEGNDMPLSVIVPGGTCTTALLLSREVNALLRKEEIQQSSHSDALDIEIVVVPCVGSAGYALRQMSALDVRTGGNGREDLPKVLKPIGQKRYFRFGEPDEAILDTFTEMQDKYDIYLDLLYGAPVWNIILQHWEASKLDNSSEASLLKGRQIMYVHSGGLEGISSQLTRYKHKGLIDSRQVQS
jgi:1-aminocyclopropane-1-carboxylate deaminase/D-cysteine desulfhydrase-like pyridoxal-dependent ACC family enzyme